MVIIKKEITDEGETIPYQLADLDVTTEVDGENDRVLILWPVTIAHRIDEESPFYDMNPRELLSSQFEVILTLEGVTEETGNTIQVSFIAISRDSGRGDVWPSRHLVDIV